MQFGVGDVLAGYRILRVLGSGGMGEVYLVEHPRLPRRDALKLLRGDTPSGGDYRARFEREADLASALWHPNIVGLHDRGEVDGQLWIAMDFVEGTNAAELIAHRYPAGMPVDLVVKIVTAVASALDYAHRQGLLHRDVKPANIMVTHTDDHDDQRILLADFGIARDVNDISGLTTTNMSVGTVAYAAPEQLMGETVGGRTDQYALAATAYHLLTGVQLFPHSNPAVVIGRHLNALPPRLADLRAELAELDPVFESALAKDPNDRFTRCTDFADALAVAATSRGGAVSASAPTKTAPVPPPTPKVSNNSQPQTNRSATVRGRTLPLLALGAAALALALAATLIWQPWKTGQRSPESGPANPMPQIDNSGPLTGQYAADFGPELQLTDHKILNPAPTRATFNIRSACKSTGCIAIAQATDGPTLNRQLILDYVDNHWISVHVAPSASSAISVGMKAGCEQGLSAETWETLSLTPQPDGTLSGSYEATNSNNCNTSRTVTLRRTGDVDTTDIADLSSLPARTSTPASGFRGHYRYTYHSYASRDVDGYVRTNCLRTGDRCMSYFFEPGSAEPFVFADGRWTLHYNAPVSCGGPDGPRVRIERDATLDLPQPTEDPIDVVTGRGDEGVADSACSIPRQSYTLRFQRIGD